MLKHKHPYGSRYHVAVWNSLQEMLVFIGYGLTNRILKEGREKEERDGKFKDDKKAWLVKVRCSGCQVFWLLEKPMGN